MDQEVVIVLDCGATNVRTIAIGMEGQILARASVPNNTKPDPEYKDCLIWDVSEIWNKFIETTRKVIKELEHCKIAAITVTTFGVDGALFDAQGNMLYPVISWQCTRTEPVMNSIDKYLPLDKLFAINGIQPYAFNTINKLIWFKENKPGLIDQATAFLFLPSIFIYYLSGSMVTDTTMAGTSMLTDLHDRTFSEEILNAIGLDENLFPDLIEPGIAVGSVMSSASMDLGIPEGTPVIAAGHDTQFALFGSGADENVPVLSSGTWEILMARTTNVPSSQELLTAGLTTEFDALPGLYNPGIQWIASGALEWIADMFYPEEKKQGRHYEVMIEEARHMAPGSNGMFVNPDFLKVSEGMNKGLISGLHMNTKRNAVYRATLESLAFKVKKSLKLLEISCGFKAEKLFCVGGGSKNSLWNQIRSDVLNLPVKVIEQKETTVLGAALFAFAGAGCYESPLEARTHIRYGGDVFLPGEEAGFYQLLEESYAQIL